VEKAVDTPLSERFEVAFNQIHNWMQKNVKKARSDSFTDLLHAGIQIHSIIRKHFHHLKMFARLRNSIVHDKIELGFYIAEPHIRVVNRIEKIAAQLALPREALSIATKPVFFYYNDAKLQDVLTVIHKRSYSIFPIYDENGFKWTLTADCIIQWFANNLVGSIIQLEDVTVKDLFPLKKHTPIEFIRKNADMFEIEEIFEKYHVQNKKLAAVIITETGLQTEKPLGIVTPWDLVEIDVLD
jgi:predicted transcriptional regulator